MLREYQERMSISCYFRDSIIAEGNNRQLPEKPAMAALTVRPQDDIYRTLIGSS